MNSLRIAVGSDVPAEEPCCRCGRDGRCWDRIATSAYCPDCQEEIVLGLSRPLAERTRTEPCAACGRKGTVCYQTQPMDAQSALEIDLCPEHLRGLIGRRLVPNAYHQIRRQLHSLGLSVNQVFLMHDLFYDDNGRALRPAAEPE